MSFWHMTSKSFCFANKMRCKSISGSAFYLQTGSVLHQWNIWTDQVLYLGDFKMDVIMILDIWNSYICTAMKKRIWEILAAKNTTELLLLFVTWMVYLDPTYWPAPSWLVSSVGRALHRYRRGHGFKSRTGLNFFQVLFSTTSSVVFLSARIF